MPCASKRDVQALLPRNAGAVDGNPAGAVAALFDMTRSLAGSRMHRSACCRQLQYFQETFS